MLDAAELREIMSVNGKDGYFVSLYLNVDPAFNKRGDYMVHFKNMIKKTTDSLDKSVYKKVKDDIGKIEGYVSANKRLFRKGLAILSSAEKSFWRDYHLAVPVKNELIVDRMPYAKPLMDIFSNKQRHAVVLVDKESARIFIVHLGEIVEYSEVHTSDIPGKHKKGGWFALSQNHYERHIDFHVGVHLKKVVDKLDAFISEEQIGRLIVGGSDEAVSMFKCLLHKTVLDKLIGIVKIEMFAKPDEVMRRIEPVINEYEKKKEELIIETLIANALKKENAVLGLADVLSSLQEQRVMKLVVLSDFKESGYACGPCGFLSLQQIDNCPLCSGKTEYVDHMAELSGELAVQQGAIVKIVADNRRLSEAGGIGAFLRF